MNHHLTKIICLECGHEMLRGEEFPLICNQCNSPWLDAVYDYTTIKDLWPHAITNREHTLWRYKELLPLDTAEPQITMGEGYTPLIRLLQIEEQFNHPHIYVKDERKQPTNSFKDRQAALSVTDMYRQGIKECVLASTGNAAVAYAAYCARAGIRLWVFLTDVAPAEKMREVALYGAEVVKVSGTYDEAKHVAAAFAKRKGLYMDKGAKTIPSKESMKTLAFEIAEQLGLVFHPDNPNQWQAPDWYIQAVSGGIGPLGVWKGFSELLQMGLIDKMPKLGIVQASGCAPMVQAFNNGQETATPVIPKTLIHVLATGDPGYAYVQLREAVLSNNGAMIDVQDGETFQAMRKIASRAGLSVEPATAVAFAGLNKMLTEHIIAEGEVVVVNCSGHTLPAESHILGDQYDKYILDLNVIANKSDASFHHALQDLDERVTTIVIVDDNPNDRRLIRRLLQSYKNYRVYEATNGDDGLRVIRDRQPDLVVTDLTMPEMDGFSLLEAIKTDKQTSHIPVVVISAKSLTGTDHKLLEAFSDSVWTKGDFNTRELVEHVVNTLGHSPISSSDNDKTRHLSQNKPQTSAELVQKRNTIVIIDDNDNDLRLIKRMIETDSTIKVIEAKTGRSGLKAIYNHHPDLIVLDVMLPDMNGMSILDTLQNEMNLKEIPIILVTAGDVDAKKLKLSRPNICAILKKASIQRQQILGIINEELSD